MIPGIRIGTIAECEVLSRLAADRFLVRMNGRDLVMQVNRLPVSEQKMEVQVVDVRNNMVFARLLESEYPIETLVRQYGLNSGLSQGELELVLRFLKTAGLALSEETVRRFLALRQSCGDRDLALAALVRRYPAGFLEKLLAGGEAGLKQAMAAVEKFVINFPDRAENRSVLDLLHRLNTERVIDLQKSLLVFRPDLEHRLWKELKEQRRDAAHLKLALLGLKGSLKGGKGPAEEIEALLRRFNLDNLRSVHTPCYEAGFHTLLWKDGEDWREAEAVVRRSIPDDEYLLTLKTGFPRLGQAEIRCRHSPSRNLTEVRVGVAEPQAMEYVKSHLTAGGLKVEVCLWDAAGTEELPFGLKNWKKIDLVI